MNFRIIVCIKMKPRMFAIGKHRTLNHVVNFLRKCPNADLHSKYRRINNDQSVICEMKQKQIILFFAEY